MARLNTGSTYRVAIDTEYTYIYIDAADKKDLIKFLVDNYVGEHSICGVKRLGKDGMLYPEAVITEPLFKELAAQKERNLSVGEPPKKVYLLCQEYEDEDAIREFTVLAVSEDSSSLKNLMRAKIKQDEYGFVMSKGIFQNEENYFSTNFDCGFLEYYILCQDILSQKRIQEKVEAIQNLNPASRKGGEKTPLDKQVALAQKIVSSQNNTTSRSKPER